MKETMRHGARTKGGVKKSDGHRQKAEGITNCKTTMKILQVIKDLNISDAINTFETE